LPTPDSATASPSSAPPAGTPSAVPGLEIDSLPRVELADVHATAVCDPQGPAAPGAGEPLIWCSDGLALAVAVVRTATPDPVTRLYLRRPRCASTGCTRGELSTARVFVWTASSAYDVALDGRDETVPPPVIVSNPGWPSSGSGALPAVRRPAIPSAPAEVARRTPYPFCGRAELSDPPRVPACFRAAVLAGRRVEMIDQVYGTEGGAILQIDRYDGEGRIIQYQHDQSVNGDGTATDHWSRSEGAMILSPDSFGWDFEPWLSEGLSG
jgi:hypothetical protein